MELVARKTRKSGENLRLCCKNLLRTSISGQCDWALPSARGNRPKGSGHMDNRPKGCFFPERVGNLGK
jgi:hypothetical protein